MSESNYKNADARHQRIQRLKRMIIVALLTLIAIPIVCCIVLFFRVGELNRQINDMEMQVEQLTNLINDQQQQIQEWLDVTVVSGQGEAAGGQAAVGAADVNSVSTQSQEETSANTEDYLHKVYLTFDDGPSEYTDEILDILARYDVKATFFVLGKEDDASRERLARIAEEGHTIGIHSYSHKYSEIYRSVENFAADYQKAQDYVYEVTGRRSTVYRFPGGSSNTVSNLDMREFAEYLAEEGVEFFDWNISSGDAVSKVLDVESIVENCTQSIPDWETAVILMHDSAEKITTVEALPIVIENILAMEDTVILPITEDTKPVHHIDINVNE